MKLSIVSAYNNRKPSVINTLNSFLKSKYKDDIEVIITDDASDEGQTIDDLPSQFPFLKVIKVTKEEKWWKNPCVPFNKAIKEATAPIILLQNPENYHVTDIIAHAIENVNKDNYYTYKVFALTQEQSKDLSHSIANVDFESRTIGGVENGWYNHPKHRAGYFHFVSSIDADVLKNTLNGFDERYAMGWGFDDNDLVIRITRAGLKKHIVDDSLALHQWHPPSIAFNPTNESLCWQTHNSNIIKANV